MHYYLKLYQQRALDALQPVFTALLASIASLPTISAHFFYWTTAVSILRRNIGTSSKAEILVYFVGTSARDAAMTASLNITTSQVTYRDALLT
jgi:hypothetical protein